MSKKILVPLGQNDRTEEMIPYIEKSGAAWDAGCLPNALSGGWRLVGERRVWYEGRFGGKEAGELLLLGREPRKTRRSK